MFRFGVTAALALAVLSAGCSSAPSTVPAPETLVSIQRGDLAALVIAFDGQSFCPSSALSFVNLDTGQRQIVETGWSDLEPSRPAVAAVHPGRYRIAAGVCTASLYRLPALSAWFGEVRVEAGEVVYVGTLSARTIDRSSRSPYGDPVSRFLMEAPSDVLTFFMEFEIVNDPTVRAQLAEIDPALSERMVHRPLPTLITPEQLNGYLDEAFAPDENGVLPDRQQARDRLRAIIIREFDLPADSEKGSAQ